MNSDKKLALHSKQRRKSPCNIVVIHDVAHQNGGANGPTGSPYNASQHTGINGHSTIHSNLYQGAESSPNLSVDSRDGTIRKHSISSEDRGDNCSMNGTSTPVRRSHTESEISAHLQKTPLLPPGDSDEVFYDSSSMYGSFNNKDPGSLHRPITIEEELFSKVNQINSLVHLWRKRWKQQKDYSDLLSKQIQTTEKECDAMVHSVKEIYTEKVKRARKDLSKEILDKQKLEREKATIELLYKKALEAHNSEKEKLHAIIQKKTDDNEFGQSLQNEARINIKDLKKELSKVKRENEKLVRHIGKLRDRIGELEEKVIQQTENGDRRYCDGNCEHKLLFDLAIQRLKFYENYNNLSCGIRRSSSQSEPVRKYIAKSDLGDPENVSVQALCSQLVEGLDLDAGSAHQTDNTSRDSGVAESPTLPSLCSINNNTMTSPVDLYAENRQRSLSTCSKDSAVVESLDLSHDAIADLKLGSRDSIASDSALSVECHPPSPHVVLRKSLTTDSVCSLSAPQKTKLSRRTTWTHYEISPPDSGNCSPRNSPREGQSEPDVQQCHSATKGNAISGFEGLRERRNGIIDMDREVALQLKLGKGKKAKEFSELFKKFSFSAGHGNDTGVKDKEVHGSEKKNFMNINMSMFSRKKSNPVTD